VATNTALSIPPSAIGDVESKTCQIPDGASFWRLTVRTHKQSVRTRILDGGATLFESTDWEHPGATSHTATPFLTFTTGGLTYECTYDNPTGRTITAGHSSVTDEACIAIGYFFPATNSLLCVNDVGPL
jgi:hypothetical protein